MKYKNTKTGVVIEVNSKIRGDWELLDVPAPKVEEKPKATAKKRIK